MHKQGIKFAETREESAKKRDKGEKKRPAQAGRGREQGGGQLRAVPPQGLGRQEAPAAGAVFKKFTAGRRGG